MLVENYFDMKKKQCKEALDAYKRFIVRSERIREYLKVCEVGSFKCSTNQNLSPPKGLMNNIPVAQ